MYTAVAWKKKVWQTAYTICEHTKPKFSGRQFICKSKTWGEKFPQTYIITSLNSLKTNNSYFFCVRQFWQGVQIGVKLQLQNSTIIHQINDKGTYTGCLLLGFAMSDIIFYLRKTVSTKFCLLSLFLLNLQINNK